MLSDLIGCMKRAALEAVEVSKPVAIMFGTVTSTEPLKILVEQKMILEAKQLVLTRNVTEHNVEMTVEHWTEEDKEHTHKYKGRKLFKVHNNLLDGDKVILLRIQGGQKFVVWDRLA